MESSFRHGMDEADEENFNREKNTNIEVKKKNYKPSNLGFATLA